jgi:hypothetical protein
MRHFFYLKSFSMSLIIADYSVSNSFWIVSSEARAFLILQTGFPLGLSLDLLNVDDFFSSLLG